MIVTISPAILALFSRNESGYSRNYSAFSRNKSGSACILNFLRMYSVIFWISPHVFGSYGHVVTFYGFKMFYCHNAHRDLVN